LPATRTSPAAGRVAVGHPEHPLVLWDPHGRPPSPFLRRHHARLLSCPHPDRLAVMDSQGIEATVNFATLPELSTNDVDIPGYPGAQSADYIDVPKIPPGYPKRSGWLALKNVIWKIAGRARSGSQSGSELSDMSSPPPGATRSRRGPTFE